MASFFAKALMPFATSIFRKTAPSVLGGVRSLFSKAPTLTQVSSGLSRAVDVGDKVLSSPLVDVLASQAGAGRTLKLARQGVRGLETAKNYTDEAQNVLEKVKQVAPQPQVRPMPNVVRMPSGFEGGQQPLSKAELRHRK